MNDVNVWAIVVAAVAAFIASAVYYGVAGAPAAQQGSAPERPAWSVPVVEILRNLILAVPVTWLVTRLHPGVGEAVVLAAGLWLIPVVLFSGAVFHEGVAVRSAAVHLLDWAIKLLIVVLIIGLWR
ncbi:DUF1761 family protein [Gordonia soli]|uniref:Uncharacterized protein n=1 Tax=Gordonia soli NBRC 108243 TaxID=1223545 RepID=M0QFK5_9ACTN|nr:DUF1761 family protein [Gordonia soli]GAC67244.1 hypothetical protein GS4_06_00900 [Gordonia soli NBRC 108243]